MKETNQLPVIGIMRHTIFALSALTLFTLTPSLAAAAYTGEVAGWIPYWSDTEGLKSATKQIKKLDTVYPFIYEVNDAGQVVDKADVKEDQWQRFFKLAKRNKVEIIPTLAWFDGAKIHETLSDRGERRALIREITALVDKHNYAGINIDFEQKEAGTMDDFSKFLRELKRALGRDLLTCAIEARTPPEDLYKEVPNPLVYANDYKAINEHCDRIELMTYDQQRADLTLNKTRQGVPYAPVADREWVEKVVELALKDFAADKVLVGVATYGRAWDVTVAPDWYRDYTRVAALNQPRILELSEIYKSGIGRDGGGEAVISYFPEDSVYKIFNSLGTPPQTPVGYEAAAKALLIANTTKQTIPVRFVTWSDATAIADKLKIAEEYNLRGVTIFKIDGQEDPALWELF